MFAYIEAMRMCWHGCVYIFEIFIASTYYCTFHSTSIVYINFLHNTLCFCFLLRSMRCCLSILFCSFVLKLSFYFVILFARPRSFEFCCTCVYECDVRVLCSISTCQCLDYHAFVLFSRNQIQYSVCVLSVNVHIYAGV